MVNASTFQPFESVYRNYLAGLTPGFSRAYQAQNAPLAQLAYWSSPADAGYSPLMGTATQGVEGLNPFSQFLQGNMGTFGGTTTSAPGAGGEMVASTTPNPYSPMTSEQWRTRAGDVRGALEANPFGDLTGSTQDQIDEFTPEQIAQLRIQQRFGMGGGDTGQQLANQAALVNAAVTTQMPYALRRENAAILQRMFDQWQGSGATGNYLNQAQNVWSGFGI